MLSRAAIAETAGAAGISRDVSANAGSAFRGIGSVELIGSPGGGLETFKRDSGAHLGTAFRNLQALEFLHGDHPAALRDASTGDAGPGAGDGNWNFVLRRFGDNLQQLRFARRDQDFIGVARKSGSVDQIGIHGRYHNRRNTPFGWQARAPAPLQP